MRTMHGPQDRLQGIHCLERSSGGAGRARLAVSFEVSQLRANSGLLLRALAYGSCLDTLGAQSAKLPLTSLFTEFSHWLSGSLLCHRLAPLPLCVIAVPNFFSAFHCPCQSSSEFLRCHPSIFNQWIASSDSSSCYSFPHQSQSQFSITSQGRALHLSRAHLQRFNYTFPSSKPPSPLLHELSPNSQTINFFLSSRKISRPILSLPFS